MAHLFYAADPIFLCYSNVEAAKRWWIENFDCEQVPLSTDRDDPCPSNIALKLPDHEGSTVLLSSRDEVQRAGLEVQTTVPILFCSKLKNAQKYLFDRGITAGPIEEEGNTQLFEIRDLEGNVIEICIEP